MNRDDSKLGLVIMVSMFSIHGTKKTLCVLVKPSFYRSLELKTFLGHVMHELAIMIVCVMIPW